jgi:hypothetical protein
VGVLVFALVWVLNFAISIWNAYAVGKVWVETRVVGGWRRFMCWMGAVMSACGFTWCYLSFLALTAHHFKWLTDEEVMVALNLGYVLLVPFMLFAGYAITLDSWARAFRQGGFLNYGMAAWNTYATIHNTFSAWRNLGGAFSSLTNYFGGGKRERSRNDNNSGLVVLLLVAFALLAGVFTTAVIIRRVAATDPLPPPPTGEADKAPLPGPTDAS